VVQPWRSFDTTEETNVDQAQYPEPTPEQLRAVKQLKEAIDNIFAKGMGVHAIAAVLDDPEYIRPSGQMRHDLSHTGHELENSQWCVKSDPFRRRRAEDSIVPGPD
jgi:hypothetical protein